MEVGPRDGLQNIKNTVPTPVKIELIQRLAAAGLRNIEATSFVSPKWVPQLSDGAEVFKSVSSLTEQRGMRLPVLTPNVKGVQNAIKNGAREVVVFASATEAFSKKNQNCSVDEALRQAEDVAREAQRNNVAVRGVVSCIFSDPYSGPTKPEQVQHVVQRMLEMGCHEVGLGDTLGVGTPRDTQKLLEFLLRDVSANKLAGHFHDTYGQAVANVMRAYDMGIRSFDSSVAGLGGCPYAKGAKGNLATEDMVYMFEQSGIDTGVNLQALSLVGEWISQQLKLPNSSRAGAALVANAQSAAEAASTVKNPENKEGTYTAAPSKSTREWKVVEDTGELRVTRAGTAVKITLTRGGKGNSMTPGMVDGLTRLFRDFANDKSIFHIILNAEGRFFCTGMDLSSDTDRTSKSAESSYYNKVMDMFTAIDESPQTTIAAIDGPCYGGGVGLGFNCDVRLVSPNARWTLTEIKLGLSPAIISKFLAREWGFAFFREAMLSGREVTPAELLRIGAVHGITDGSGSLDELVEDYLNRLERCAPYSASVCKELVRKAWINPGGGEQNSYIERTFDNMMVPGSEGEFGIQQFQKKIKKIDWARFWIGQRAKL
jgi:hydroxymethylglutaryl-CoA lyase